ncbi:MAG TPA: hypothetical protein VFK35_06940 [Candidatus Limnocylindrales bacterium]|nr:hypothetical protein [Candidatus Limnocylindrales bacterium]
MTARLADSSYPADDALLAELRADWPPGPVPVGPAGAARGYATTDLAARPPVAALRLADRFAVALVEDGEAFLVVPLARDGAGGWRAAVPGDGFSAFVAGVPLASEAAIEADQTNASVVVGERAIVKWFRRVGPRPSRATPLLAHLAAVGFREIPAPLGSITWRSPAGAELAIAQGDGYLPGARDGWEWCVERVAGHVAHVDDPCPAGCDPWIGAPLGRLVGRLHAALATPSGVIPESTAEIDPGTVAGWRAQARVTLEEALSLTGDPELVALAPVMRADLDALPTDRLVALQPVHGDLHVGQVLEWSGGLAVIDFDGNPALGDDANALRQPVERDIAQMTSSLDHVGRIVDRQTEGSVGAAVGAWIERTRREFLEALARPPDPTLLAAFEVEQECRELVYAARFLPRWRYAPLATLRARYGP